MSLLEPNELEPVTPLKYHKLPTVPADNSVHIMAMVDGQPGRLAAALSVSECRHGTTYCPQCIGDARAVIWTHSSTSYAHWRAHYAAYLADKERKKAT